MVRLPYIVKNTESHPSSEFRRDDSFVFSKNIKDWQRSRPGELKRKLNKKRHEK